MIPLDVPHPNIIQLLDALLAPLDTVDKLTAELRRRKITGEPDSCETCPIANLIFSEAELHAWPGFDRVRVENNGPAFWRHHAAILDVEGDPVRYELNDACNKFIVAFDRYDAGLSEFLIFRYVEGGLRV